MSAIVQTIWDKRMHHSGEGRPLQKPCSRGIKISIDRFGPSLDH